MVFLGGNSADWDLYGDDVVHKGVRRLSSAPRSYGGGTFGYVVRRRAALVFLELARSGGVQQPIDWFMLGAVNRLTLYMCDPALVLSPPPLGQDSDTHSHGLPKHLRPDTLEGARRLEASGDSEHFRDVIISTTPDECPSYSLEETQHLRHSLLEEAARLISTGLSPLMPPDVPSSTALFTDFPQNGSAVGEHLSPRLGIEMDASVQSAFAARHRCSLACVTLLPVLLSAASRPSLSIRLPSQGSGERDDNDSDPEPSDTCAFHSKVEWAVGVDVNAFTSEKAAACADARAPFPKGNGEAAGKKVEGSLSRVSCYGLFASPPSLSYLRPSAYALAAWVVNTNGKVVMRGVAPTFVTAYPSPAPTLSIDVVSIQVFSAHNPVAVAHCPAHSVYDYTVASHGTGHRDTHPSPAGELEAGLVGAKLPLAAVVGVTSARAIRLWNSDAGVARRKNIPFNDDGSRVLAATTLVRFRIRAWLINATENGVDLISAELCLGVELHAATAHVPLPCVRFSDVEDMVYSTCVPLSNSPFILHARIMDIRNSTVATATANFLCQEGTLN